MQILSDAIARRLRTLCEQNHITPFQLSKRSGVPNSTIHHLLHLESNTRIQTLDRLCAALGITLADFFDADSFGAQRHGKEGRE